MGSTTSRGQTNTQVAEVDNSSGLHLLELHAPSMGLTSVITIVLCVLVFFLFKCCYKRYKNGQCCAPQILPTYLPRPWQPAAPGPVPQEVSINLQPQRTAIPMLDFNPKAPNF